jgi:hypothetical protein
MTAQTSSPLKKSLSPLQLTPWLIALVVSWSLGFAFNVYHGGIIGWLRKAYYHKATLASQIQSNRRIILVGGSGMHYSVNAQLMEQELGIPVFNFGLDGKLGLDVIFPLVLSEIRPGDIVLAIPEYLMLEDDDGLGTISTHFAIATNQWDMVDVSAQKWLEDGWMLGIAGLNGLVKSGVDLATKGKFDEYYSDPLTERGEPTKTWKRSSKWWKLAVDKPITPYAIQKIRQFKQDLEAKGAILILSLPVIYGQDDQKTIQNVTQTKEQLSKIAPTIYDPETLNVWTDVTPFAETHYHLKPEGRIKRTQEIVEQLKPILLKQQIILSH